MRIKMKEEGRKFEQKKEKVVVKLINLLNFRGNRL